MLIEVCANSLPSALLAQQAGAQRVELCQNLWVGGTTPSAATIEMAREQLDIDLFVLIRARAGDFCYSKVEFDLMLRDVLFCKEMGVDGVVIGALYPNASIQVEYTSRLTDAAYPMQVTFHRAFDQVSDPFRSLEQLIQLGINRILTSGQAPNAMAGKSQLRDLIQLANNRISILPGGGINHLNAKVLADYTGTNELHLSGKEIIKSPFSTSQAPLSYKDIPVFDYQQTSLEEIQKVVALFK